MRSAHSGWPYRVDRRHLTDSPDLLVLLFHISAATKKQSAQRNDNGYDVLWLCCDAILALAFSGGGMSGKKL